MRNTIKKLATIFSFFHKKIFPLKRKKNILFVLHNEIMFSHAFKCYECIKDDKRLRCWFYLPAPKLFFDTPRLKRNYKLRWISGSFAKKIPWDLIIFPDHESGFRESSHKIYIGHGHYTGKVTHGGQDYTFGYRGRDEQGKILYDKIFRPSNFAMQIINQHYPDAAPYIKVVGSPFADEIMWYDSDRKPAYSQLGFDLNKKTVFIASTWGEGSIVQSQWDQLKQQVSELAVQYNVIVSAHLNNFRTIYAKSISWEKFKQDLSGTNIYVVKPQEDSYRLLPLADLLVTENSSIGYYYTVLGRPIVYYENPRVRYLSTSLVTELKKAAYVVGDFSNVGEHIKKAFTVFNKMAMEELSDKMVSHKGTSRERYRQEIYESLGVPFKKTEWKAGVDLPLSVIIPTYNRAYMIKELLDDFLNQDEPKAFDYEIIVVDNNSKDQTRRVVESYRPRFHGRLSYLFETRQGKSFALNTGINAAQGEIIACIDDDCLLDRNYLAGIFQVFREYGSDVGVVGGKILPKWIGEDYPVWLNGFLTQPVSLEDGRPNWAKIALEGPLGILDYGERPFVIDYSQKNHDSHLFYGANIAFRRKVLQQYGGFSPDKVICEDTEICQRLFKAGVKGVYSPRIKVYHKIRGKNVAPGYYYKWHFVRGIHMELQEDYKRKFYHPLGIQINFILKTRSLLKQSFHEKELLNKIRYRSNVFFNFGQMIQIVKKNIF